MQSPGNGELWGGGAGIEGVFGVDGVDQIPQTRLQPPPSYPDTMRREGKGGRVEVSFIVGRDGRVTSASASNSDRPEFVRAAVEAVRRWRFEPGKRHGQAVSFRMTVPIYFSLDRS
ncbi:MAG: energy transducer TonB [Candidatus Synoicihabitans palmerolidicus]|nr:energy transducer TonB [Candidatus Synoicihabitans palmerolidicus]